MISNKEKNEFIKNIKLTRRDATLSSLIKTNKKWKWEPIWKSEELNTDIYIILPFLDNEKTLNKKKFIKSISYIYISSKNINKYECPLSISYHDSLICLKKIRPLKCPECGLATPDFLTICPYCGKHF